MIDGLRTQERKYGQVDVTGSLFTPEYIDTGSLNTVRLVANTIIETRGKLFSVSIGSPATFGAFIQGGSVVTSAGSLAVIQFGQGWTSAGKYYVTVTAGSYQDGNTGSIVPFLSGAYRASGVTLIGAASTIYNWIGVGL